MTYEPLPGKDQTKVLIFFFLLALAALFIIGLIPVIFLGIGIYLMRRNQDFSSLSAAITASTIYAALIALGSLPIWLSAIVENYPYLADDEVIFFGAIFLGSLGYLFASKFLLYSPLRLHADWVSENGIFSSSRNEVKRTSSNTGISFIKKGKHEQISVADELLKWAELREKKVITEEEFATAREKLLGGEEP